MSSAASSDADASRATAWAEIQARLLFREKPSLEIFLSRTLGLNHGPWPSGGRRGEQVAVASSGHLGSRKCACEGQNLLIEKPSASIQRATRRQWRRSCQRIRSHRTFTSSLRKSGPGVRAVLKDAARWSGEDPSPKFVLGQAQFPAGVAFKTIGPAGMSRTPCPRFRLTHLIVRRRPGWRI